MKIQITNEKFIGKTILLTIFFLALMVMGLLTREAYSECLFKKTLFWKMDNINNSLLKEEIRDLSHTPCDELCPQLLQDGRYGAAMKFDNKTKISVLVNNAYQWSSLDSFSIEFWMKRDNKNIDQDEMIIGRDDASTGLHWWVGISNRRGGVASAYFLDRNEEDVSRFCRGSKPIIDNTWHHIVFVRDGKLAKNSLYVDGVLADQVSFAYSGKDAFKSDTAQLNIGWLNQDPFYHYQGAMDEVAFYNVALPQWFIRDRYYEIDRTGAPCE